MLFDFDPSDHVSSTPGPSDHVSSTPGPRDHVSSTPGPRDRVSSTPDYCDFKLVLFHVHGRVRKNINFYPGIDLKGSRRLTKKVFIIALTEKCIK